MSFLLLGLSPISENVLAPRFHSPFVCHWSSINFSVYCVSLTALFSFIATPFTTKGYR